MYNLLKLLKNLYIKLSKKIGFMLIFRDERKSLHNYELKKYKTLTGIYYLPKYAYQDVIRNEIIKNRIFDKKIFELGKKFIEPGTSIIDAGANYGQMSILFSKVCENCSVHSFEASEYIFNILEKNIKLNSTNITPINCALSDISGEEYLIDPDLTNTGTYGALKIQIDSQNKDLKKNKTQIKKIDDFSFDKKISLMKIDVQGWDLKVLRGSIKTIKKNRMPIIFEYEEIFEKEMNYNFEDFLILFKNLDYKFKTVINNNFLVLPKEHKEN
tara:strand:- start:3350 stop:4162 length:813 start_codon:yes stop_codon:yes gene_type:complete